MISNAVDTPNKQAQQIDNALSAIPIEALAIVSIYPGHIRKTTTYQKIRILLYIGDMSIMLTEVSAQTLDEIEQLLSEIDPEEFRTPMDAMSIS